MDSQDAHRLWIQLRRIADALERISPPPPKLETEKKPRRGMVF